MLNMARKTIDRHRAIREGTVSCATCGQLDSNADPVWPCDAYRLAAVVLKVNSESSDGAIFCPDCARDLTEDETYTLMFGEAVCRLCHNFTGYIRERKD